MTLPYDDSFLKDYRDRMDSHLTESINEYIDDEEPGSLERMQLVIRLALLEEYHHVSIKAQRISDALNSLFPDDCCDD